jgi:peptide/nickel transport system permease protein
MAGRYLLQRLLWLIVSLTGISLITFLLIFAGPSDPARALTGDRARGVSIDHVRAHYGLDQPIYVQYLNYMQGILKGDLGNSYYFRRPVSEALWQRLPATALLAGSVMAVAMFIGIPLGMLAALRNGTIVDRGLMVMQLLSISLPTFFVGLLLIYFFGFQLRWFPLGGYGTFSHLVLPTLAVAIPWSAWYGIFLRSNMLEVISADYIRTAHAKGLSGRMVAWRHMLRNALLPVITMIGMDLASLLTGIALVEYIFNWPGIGWQALQAAQRLDIPLVMGSVLLGALIIGIGNLSVDLLYSVLDPRVSVD